MAISKAAIYFFVTFWLAVSVVGWIIFILWVTRTTPFASSLTQSPEVSMPKLPEEAEEDATEIKIPEPVPIQHMAEIELVRTYKGSQGLGTCLGDVLQTWLVGSRNHLMGFSTQDLNLLWTIDLAPQQILTSSQAIFVMSNQQLWYRMIANEVWHNLQIPVQRLLYTENLTIAVKDTERGILLVTVHNDTQTTKERILSQHEIRDAVSKFEFISKAAGFILHGERVVSMGQRVIKGHHHTYFVGVPEYNTVYWISASGDILDTCTLPGNEDADAIFGYDLVLVNELLFVSAPNDQNRGSVSIYQIRPDMLLCRHILTGSELTGSFGHDMHSLRNRILISDPMQGEIQEYQLRA